MNSPNFYTLLSIHTMPLRDLLKSKEGFTPVPGDWHVVVIDVKESAMALENGLHTDVNLVATGSIITVLNTIKSIDKENKVPYFFRGDGATFIVDAFLLKGVVEALQTYQIHVLKTLNLELCMGSIQLCDVYKTNTTLHIAKLKLNTYLITPIVRGNALQSAERIIRKKYKENQVVSENHQPLNLEGMECRWDEIFPSENDSKVFCLLVLCKEERMQSEVFVKILDEIDYQFGSLEERTPITTRKLKLDNSFQKMRKEMYARLGIFDRGYLIQNWLITYFGTYYFKFFKGGKDYLFRVTQLSDTIVLDGSINTVFSGTEKQMKQLKVLLDTLEENEDIIYGLHTTYASTMSCYIEDREENHIHFVDGTEGGYINAAMRIKNKLNRSPEFLY